MTIWITRDKGSVDCYLWLSKPPCDNGEWQARECNSGSSMSSEATKRIIGDVWQTKVPFCFEVEIGEVKRVRTKEDVIAGLKNLRINLVLDASIAAIDEAIALIENPDSSNRE